MNKYKTGDKIKSCKGIGSVALYHFGFYYVTISNQCHMFLEEEITRINCPKYLLK